MAPTSGMSITLPRNFAPSGLDNLEEPHTPDQTFSEVQLPPPPHHTTLRSRRPRINMENFASRNNALPATLFASEIPIPSIEAPRATSPGRMSWQTKVPEQSPSEKLRLRPAAYRDRQPRTPPAQTKPTQGNVRPVMWDRQRSSSSCSTRSDDSFSSSDTFTSRPTSFGGSVTSPECDTDDPFMPRNFQLIPATPTKRSKSFALDAKSSSAPKFRWTTEMDNHLWNVYQMYLSDPSITPFKVGPGMLPPLGVCNRVARVARRTWRKATKVPHQIAMKHGFRDVMDEVHAVRETTPKLADITDDDSPGGVALDDSKEKWPDKNITRRHFKELCRRRFSLTPHYQRLRESRSPSPFTDQFSRRSTHSRTTRSSSRQASTSYATRDLGISLVASTGATGPLAQLVTGDSPPLRSDEWFNTPMNSSSQTTSSPPSGLGIDTDGLAPPSSVPRLASPFQYNTWDGPSRPRRQPLPEMGHYDTVSATGPRLLSPVNLDPFTNAHKRRALNQLDDELSPSGSGLERKSGRQELVFTGAGDISQRRIRIRSRGATLGSTAETKEKLHRLFSPPATLEQPDSMDTTGSSDDIPPVPAVPAATGLAAPEPDERNKRLGSPFELDANKRSNRSKTPRHIPSMSDPFVSNPFASTSNTQSIGERLAAFSALQNHRNSSNPFE